MLRKTQLPESIMIQLKLDLEFPNMISAVLDKAREDCLDMSESELTSSESN